MAKSKTPDPYAGMSKKEIAELPWNTQAYRDAKANPTVSNRSALLDQDKTRLVAEAEAARIRHIAGTADAAPKYSPYIEKLQRKNPNQEFSVFDDKTGKWITVNEGMRAPPKVRATPATTPATNPGVPVPPPGVVTPVPLPTPVVQQPATTGRVVAQVPPVAGVPVAVARPVAATPIVGPSSINPAVIPKHFGNKSIANEKLSGMGQRAEMGRDFGSQSGYSKKDGLFKF